MEINATAEAARRALDTLLRNAHSRSVMLRTPAPAIAGDATEQLGLATPLFQDIPLAPAVFRKVYGAAAKDSHASRELLLSATAVEALTGSRDFAAADALFATAFGIVVDDVMLAITSVTEVEAGGIICGYRIGLREPAISA